MLELKIRQCNLVVLEVKNRKSEILKLAVRIFIRNIISSGSSAIIRGNKLSLISS